MQSPAQSMQLGMFSGDPMLSAFCFFWLLIPSTKTKAGSFQKAVPIFPIYMHSAIVLRSWRKGWYYHIPVLLVSCSLCLNSFGISTAGQTPLFWNWGEEQPWPSFSFFLQQNTQCMLGRKNNFQNKMWLLYRKAWDQHGHWATETIRVVDIKTLYYWQEQGCVFLFKWLFTTFSHCRQFRCNVFYATCWQEAKNVNIFVGNIKKKDVKKTSSLSWLFHMILSYLFREAMVNLLKSKFIKGEIRQFWV